MYFWGSVCVQKSVYAPFDKLLTRLPFGGWNEARSLGSSLTCSQHFLRQIWVVLQAKYVQIRTWNCGVIFFLIRKFEYCGKSLNWLAYARVSEVCMNTMSIGFLWHLNNVHLSRASNLTSPIPAGHNFSNVQSKSPRHNKTNYQWKFIFGQWNT